MKISEQLWPRIVVLVTSTEKGRDNVMTASFVCPVSFDPKYIMVAVAPNRKTIRNIKKSKEFAVNLCSENMIEAAIICGSYSGEAIDKFKLAKLTKEKSKMIKSPLIKESPISFECKLEFLKKFGDHYLCIGKALHEKIRNKEFIPLLHKTKNVFPKLSKD